VLELMMLSVCALQLALYTRCELNIRTTANLLLAYAADRQECRPFLQQYFCATVRLPSDWVDVAEQYQVWCQSSYLVCLVSFSALVLLAGRQEEHLAAKN